MRTHVPRRTGHFSDTDFDTDFDGVSIVSYLEVVRKGRSCTLPSHPDPEVLAQRRRGAVVFSTWVWGWVGTVL